MNRDYDGYLSYRINSIVLIGKESILVQAVQYPKSKLL